MNNDGEKDVPPTANIKGIDLVTEGVLTMGYAFQLLKRFDSEEISEEFFEDLDGKNGGAKLARLLLEECTEVCFYVGKANNKANYADNQLFDVSIRKNLVERLKKILKHMGKIVNIRYY